MVPHWSSPLGKWVIPIFERLVPLVDYLAGWQLLINLSQKGPADYREKVQNLIRFSSTSLQQGSIHSGQPRAGSGARTRSSVSVGKRGHRTCSSVHLILDLWLLNCTLRT